MRRLAVLLAVTGLLALPAAAGAMIQLQRGIAGAALGNTQAQVRAALGAPVRVRTQRTDQGRLVLWRYRGGIEVFFVGGTRVTQVETSGRADRTPGGIGVGSTERALRRGVSGLRCRTESGGRSCRLGRLELGHRVTEFFERGGRVTRVVVGVVLD